MKILMYCQHVLGIGHFFRSMEIARALQHHEVLFVEGGDPLDGFAPPAHVRRAFLPALMMDAEFDHFQTAGSSLDAIRNERQRLLMDYFLEFCPEVLIIELFPFGRKHFQFELLPILELIRRDLPQVKVVCSLRDVLVEKPDQVAYENRVLGILNTYFDLLLIHSDPQLVTLEETFSQVKRIAIPVIYTGFVARRPLPSQRKHGGKTIVASSGGGKVGMELLEATIGAAQLLPYRDLILKVYIGPYMEQQQREALAQAAAKDPRTGLYPFSSDFLKDLMSAELSISMAGYNTCMDILSAQVKALVYPFSQNREQALRAGKLEKLGLVRVLESLEVEPLARALEEALGNPATAPRAQLNLSGARNTALAVEKYYGKH